jgi:hypothetical protein
VAAHPLYFFFANRNRGVKLDVVVLAQWHEPIKQLYRKSSMSTAAKDLVQGLFRFCHM